MNNIKVDQFKLCNKLIEILDVENKLYTHNSLRSILNTKLKTVNKYNKILPILLQEYLKEDKIINFDYLLRIIITHYIEYIYNINFDYYSYKQKPNYKNL